jgi:hypothetical protein
MGCRVLSGPVGAMSSTDLAAKGLAEAAGEICSRNREGSGPLKLLPTERDGTGDRRAVEKLHTGSIYGDAQAKPAAPHTGNVAVVAESRVGQDSRRRGG